MKAAFPTQENLGLNSAVFAHFGSARYFIIVDTETDEFDVTDNRDIGHTHGNCQPLAALGGKIVNAVVAGGIGAGALNKLIGGGITVYRAAEGTISENLKLLKSGLLPKFDLAQTCSGHHSHECAHGSALPVQEGANRLVDIPAQLCAARFEFGRDAFPPDG